MVVPSISICYVFALGLFLDMFEHGGMKNTLTFHETSTINKVK